MTRKKFIASLIWGLQRVHYAFIYLRLFRMSIRLQMAADYFQAETRTQEEVRANVLRVYGFLHFGLVNAELDHFVRVNLVRMESWTFEQTAEFRLWFLEAFIPRYFVEVNWPQYRRRHMRRFFSIIRSL